MPTSDPAVSVLMAVYNGERYLRSAVESVLDQTRGDFEFLIVDDGSTDGTPRILSEYAREDPRIVIHHLPHTGRTAALNFGWRQARAGLIARLDADDIALPDRLERQLRFLEANEDVALLGGGALLIDDNGKTFAEERLPTCNAEIRDTLQHSSPFYHSNVVFRRRAVEALGGYRAAFEPAEDYDLWLRMAEGYGLANLREFVGKYRYHPQQESVVLAETLAVSVVAARASARDRHAGRPDRLDGFERIDAELLATMGIDGQELIETTIRHALWLARTLSHAGQRSAASPLWDLALSRVRHPSVTPELRDEARRQAKLARSWWRRTLLRVRPGIPRRLSAFIHQAR